MNQRIRALLPALPSNHGHTEAESVRHSVGVSGETSESVPGRVPLGHSGLQMTQLTSGQRGHYITAAPTAKFYFFFGTQYLEPHFHRCTLVSSFRPWRAIPYSLAFSRDRSAVGAVRQLV